MSDEKQGHTPGPWHWRIAENGEGAEETTLVGSPDEWKRCEYFCFGWPEGGSECSRGPLGEPGHEHNMAPTVLSAAGWHGSGDLVVDPRGADAGLIAAAPDLLEACQAMDAHYSASLDHQPSYVRLARAAIAKAEALLTPPTP